MGGGGGGSGGRSSRTGSVVGVPVAGGECWAFAVVLMHMANRAKCRALFIAKHALNGPVHKGAADGPPDQVA